MEVASFCRQSRVVVVAGKGGVGKSTMVAALAKMAADAGLSVLIIELEGKPGIRAAFGGHGPLAYEESLLGVRRRARRAGGRSGPAHHPR